MGNPQIEDGFIRIANELYDAIMRHPFTARQLKIMMAIMRKTYGYGKKTDDISASQIGVMCDIPRNHVTVELNKLAEKNAITKTSGRFGSIVGINKDYRKWSKREQKPSEYSAKGSTECVLDSTESVLPDVCDEVVRILDRTSTESVLFDSTESVHTKDNYTKDNRQKKKPCANASAFALFWDAYPKKKAKANAQKAFNKINPDEKLFSEIMDAVLLWSKSDEWKRDGGKFIPYPASWLNARRWEDEMDSADISINFFGFIEQCRNSGEKPISGYKPLIDYVNSTGLPMEFVQLAWEEFKSEYMPGGQKDFYCTNDWRLKFFEVVRKGYYRLWFAKPSPDGSVQYELTTQGHQARMIHKEAA